MKIVTDKNERQQQEQMPLEVELMILHWIFGGAVVFWLMMLLT